MSSVVSSMIGGQTQENVAQTQANQSDYAVNVNAGTTTRGQDIQNAQFNQGLLEQEKRIIISRVEIYPACLYNINGRATCHIVR